MGSETKHSFGDSTMNETCCAQDVLAQDKRQKDLAGAINELVRDWQGELKRVPTRKEWEAFVKQWFKSNDLIMV
jgi:predicted SpoU family rRNA methylase